MRKMQVLSTLLVLATQFLSHGEASGSSYGMRGYTSKQSLMSAGSTTVDVDSSETGAVTSSSDSSSITFPESTLVIASSVTEQPTTTAHLRTETPTAASAPTLSTATPNSECSSSNNESSIPTSGSTQPAPATSAPIFANGPASESSSSHTPTTSTSGVSASLETNRSDSKSDDCEVSIAEPSADSSTFQIVESEECSADEVDNVYTLYSNCRSAFDLCVAASDYQIFPYQGVHPTQAQIQGMAESDACVAVFIIVIEANFSACTVGGMPLVSAVETLLKISVDLEKGIDDEAPTADEFQELLAWRYEVDLAKAAGVPYDGSSELYADFDSNLDEAIENTRIRVHEDLTVDVRLSNGSYEIFEDAIDLVVTDASAADLMPGYVVASSNTDASSSSGSSTSHDATAIGIESSSAVAYCAQIIWSLVIAVVASAFVFVEGTSRRV